MPYAKTSLRAEQRALRDKMRGVGLDHRQIAVEFARRYNLRPRAAWRHAHGWSLKEAAERISSYAAHAGLHPDRNTVAMTGPHLCERENWPGPGTRPTGRKPTPYLFSLLANVYGCAVADLLDLADYEHLSPADLLVIGQSPSVVTSKEVTTSDHADPGPAARAGIQRMSELHVVELGPVIGNAVPVGRRDFTAIAASALLCALEPWAAGHDGQQASRRTVELQTPAELRSWVDSAKRDYQACRYRELAVTLPGLLTQAQSASGQFSGDAKQRCDALLAEVYHVAASLLLKTGDHALAGAMADRSMQAAQTSGDILALGSSARILTHFLLATGNGAQVVELATAVARKIESGRPRLSPVRLSVYGSLLLRGAIAAAAQDSRSSALEMLAEAEEAATRLGSEGNHYWTAFGPLNVLLHRVHVATLLGDAGTALAYAARVRPELITVAERRASFWVDVAQACAQRRWPQRAFDALLAAEDCAPEEITARPTVRDLISDLQASDPRQSLYGLHEFAARTAAAKS
jgi:hypothetical protein